MKYGLAVVLILLSGQAFAMFCPDGFNSINVGDTIEEVQKQCGKPTAETSKDAPVTGLPQEWGYFKAPIGSQMTLKVSVAFDQDKVVNISVNGQSMQTTNICGAAITVGDALSSVKSACGKPSYINQSQAQQAGVLSPTKMTELNYNTTVLIFENGRLKTRK